MKKMKFLLVFTLLAGLSFTSCSDDDNESTTNGNIVGKWNPVKSVTEFGGQELGFDYENEEPTCGKDYIEFATGNVFNRAVYSKNIDTQACQLTSASAATYTKNGDDLVITGTGIYAGTYKISRLNSSELRYYSTSTNAAGTTTTTYFFTKDSSN